MKKLRDEDEAQLYCTPPHITEALLTREKFHGMIWEPAAGRGHIANVFRPTYPNIFASDLNDWGYWPCCIEDFLTSTREADNIVTNPPYKLKVEFLARAKMLARRKVAMLMPVDVEYSVDFFQNHKADSTFPWKALYGFVQAVPWPNLRGFWNRMRVGWFVFERGYEGPVVRQSIMFRKITSSPY
jgi:hypothetical protein